MTIHSPLSGEHVDAAIEDDALRDIYRTIRTIAAVGASANAAKEANAIPAYLAAQGFQVVAVSPRPGELFGHAVAASLAEVPGDIDVVDVFRPPAEAEQVAAAAAAAGASILWFQPGTDSDSGVRAAVGSGLTVVTGHCMGATHRALGLSAAS